MSVPPRHPYAGELVFTAFSGSHQDAINKGKMYMEEPQRYVGSALSSYRPGRCRQRIRADYPHKFAVGQGGTAFILANNYGIKMPKAMHPEFGAVVQNACEEKGKELTADEVFDLFQKEYRNVNGPYRLVNYKISEEKTRTMLLQQFISRYS